MATDDVRSMRGKPFLYHYDLDGRDVVVTIRDVKGGEIATTKGKEKKAIMFFEGTDKGLALNTTNINTNGALLGSFKRSDWIGKKITLYATQTDFAGKTVDCVRVRNVAPKANAVNGNISDGPANEEEIAKKQEAARAAG
jgi:hypothetical protein